MAGTTFSNDGTQGPHPLWMFLTAISGADDEVERARLMATGLPSLIQCRVSGVAIFDESTSTCSLIIQHDGQVVDSSQTEQIREELEPIFWEALRRTTLLMVTREGEKKEIRIPPSIEKLGIHNLVVAPLRTLSRRLGMIVVGREELERVSLQEELVLMTLAQQSAIGFENLRLYQTLKQYSHNLQDLVAKGTAKLRQSEEKQRVLLEINNAIIAISDRESLLHALAEALRKILPFDRLTLTLLDTVRDVLKVQALITTSDGKRFLTVAKEFPRQGSPLALVYDQKRPLIRQHLERGQRLGVEDALLKEEGIQSYVAIPLMTKGEPFGSLNLGSHSPEEYSQSHAELLTEVGQQVALTVENLLAYEEIAQLKTRLEEENLYLQDEIKTEHGYSDIIGKSPTLCALLRNIEMVAPTNASVLILGESGSGKELVAREIHKRSLRKSRPLVRVNCASIPRELYESEFFGHVKGAFTGAIKDRAGRFEVADGGTLFLDEVGEIPLELQSKLLRVLQEQQYERVGDERTRQVDVRVIAATNRDLHKEVNDGLFRQDLYYRLNVYPLEVVPLRSRKEDIPLLAAHLLELAAKKLNCPQSRLSQAHVNVLQSYDWPGNVRELQNVIERALITSQGGALQIDLPHTRKTDKFAPLSVYGAGTVNDLDVIPETEMQRRERDNLLAALRKTDWKVSGPGGAAKLLGVSPTTLYSRITKLGLKKTV